MAGPAILEAEGLVLRRGRRTILDRVSARFLAGSLTVVIGPNGAGKSTLISTLAGLLKPEAGSVRLDGRPLSTYASAALARRRAYLPQNARCEWPISVERVVALGLTPILPAFGDLTAAQRSRVADVMAQCDLGHLKDQAATTLSGGELARAMLGRALVGDPELLLVDEPTAGLDPRHGLDAMGRLRMLSTAGRTVVVAIHDLALALPFADNVIALRDGRVMADGPAAAAVTDELLKALYDVDARIERDASGVSVRYHAASAAG